jgi:hypothetical protein
MAKDKFWFQTTAFLLIVLPPIGLYFSVKGGFHAVTWALLAVIVIGNVLGISAS